MKAHGIEGVVSVVLFSNGLELWSITYKMKIQIQVQQPRKPRASLHTVVSLRIKTVSRKSGRSHFRTCIGPQVFSRTRLDSHVSSCERVQVCLPYVSRRYGELYTLVWTDVPLKGLVSTHSLIFDQVIALDGSLVAEDRIESL